jgi:hypothetical protein
MSAYMSVDTLAELLKSIGVENLDVTLEYIQVEDPPEFRIVAKGKCYPPARVEREADDV